MTLHADLAARAPPRATVSAPTGASTVTRPQPVEGLPATVTPGGKLSSKPGEPNVWGTVNVLKRRRVRSLVSSTAIGFGVKDFPTLTLRAIVRVAEGELSLVMPWAVVAAPTGMSLVGLPSRVPVTFTA